MTALINVSLLTVKWAIRDKVLHILLLLSVFLFILVPAFSLFSMRQVQELSITLSLSAASFILLIFSTLLGAASIWRDIEKRYTASLLGLPISRSSYVLGKFFGICIIILSSCVLLGILSLLVVTMSSAQYKSDIPINWFNIIIAIIADGFKYCLLASLALLISSLSTSFFMPFFTTIAIYISGSATQEVYEYISGEYGNTLSPVIKILVQSVYYVLPNFSAFNYKVQAIYGLPIPMHGLLLTLLYVLIYTAIVIMFTVWTFSRRELP
jgi:Cu-processing system permease protein